MNLSAILSLFVCCILCLESSVAQTPTAADSARVQAVNDRAWELRRQGKMNAALSLMDSASTLARSLEIHNYYISAKRRMVFILLGKMEYDQAQALALRTIQEAKELEGPNSVNEAKLYGLLGQAYSQQGDHDNGLTYFQRAIAVANTRGDERLKVDHLLGLGAVQYLLGDIEAALATFKQYEIYFLKAGSAHLLASIYNNSAVLHSELGNSEEALEYVLKAIELEENRPKKEWMLLKRSYMNVAILLLRVNRPHDALKYYDRADGIVREHFDSDPKELMKSMALRASIYSSLKEWQDALATLRREYSLRESFEKGQKMSEAFALNHINLATTYYKLGRHEKIAAVLQPMINSRPDFKDIAIAYQMMMVASFEQKDVEKGRYWAQRAINATTKLYGVQHYHNAKTYSILADLYWQLEYPIDSADVYTNLALKAVVKDTEGNIAEQLRTGNYSEASTILFTLSQKIERYFERYLHTKQLRYLSTIAVDLELANTILERQLLEGLGTEDKQYTIARYQDIYEQTVRLNYWRAERGDQGADLTAVLQAMENNKSVLLTDVLQGHYAQRISGIPDSLLAQKKAQLQHIEQLKKEKVELEQGVVSQRNTTSIKSNLAAAEQALQVFEQQLITNYPLYGQLLRKESTLKLERVQSDLLDDKTALIEFLVSDSTIYQLVVTRQTAQLYDLGIAKKELDRQIVNFRKALTDYAFIEQEATTKAYDLYHKTGRWLYEHLMAQALEPLEGIEELIVVPDYKLGHLPFEVFLVTPQEGARNYQTLDYLLQHYVLRYGYSVQLLLGQRESSPNEQKRLLTMASSYGEGIDSNLLWQRSLQQQHLRGKLQPLPAALEEALTLANTYPNAQVWIKEAASERAFKANAADYDMLHLAMHGLLNTQHPMLSAMVFTETGDSTEDNFLYAYEIAQMDLQAQLVVLSACETGYGKFEQGEGVLSLARSFMYAGVPSTVVSLWQVNDYSTSVIMEHFYHQLQAGKPTAEALTLAKRQYLKEARAPITHPAYWASFVSIGQNAIVATPAWDWGWWLALASSIALLIGFGLYRWRQKALR